MALYSNTLSVIRRYLSSAVGDLLYGQCGTTGATTTKINAPFLYQANDYYNNLLYNVYVYAGTNIGVEKRVTDWDLSTYLLTVHSAYAAACDATSYIELHHIFTTDEYLKAINLAIESLARKYFVDIKDETIVLVASTYEYTLPTNMLGIIRIITEKTADGGVFDASGEIDPRNWDIIRSYPPKLKLHEGYYSVSAGKDLRIEGYGSQPIVDDDTDTIYLPPDWLIQKAITMLPQNKIQSGKLDEVYRRALLVSAREPRSQIDPRVRWVTE